MEEKHIKKKVRFQEEKPMYFYIRHWTFAFQAARKGTWEEIARDRARFQHRIDTVENMLNPILIKRLCVIKNL